MKTILVFTAGSTNQFAQEEQQKRVEHIDPAGKLGNMQLSFELHPWKMYRQFVEQAGTQSMGFRPWAIEIPDEVRLVTGEEFLTHLRLFSRAEVKCFVWQDGEYIEYWSEAGKQIRTRTPDFGEIDSVLRG